MYNRSIVNINSVAVRRLSVMSSGFVKSRFLSNAGTQIRRDFGLGLNGSNKGNLGMVLKRSYHEKVIDHYNNPRNVGTLNKNSSDVGTGLVGAPACGDVMRLQIQVDEDTGVIKDVKFKTFGCGSAIASSSYVTELVKGKTLDDALKIKNTIIAKELSLPPVKLHCSMLAEDAIKSAVKDYRSKRNVRTPTLGPDAVISPATSDATA